MRKPRDPAWMPVPYKPSHVEAVQALQRGEADAFQQRHALDWIIQQAAGTYEPSFRSDFDGGDRETAFAEGRRFVGLQLVKMLAMTGALVAALRSKDG